MSEHVHEWYFATHGHRYGSFGYETIDYRCKVCGDVKPSDEIVLALNATEMLSAEDSEVASHLIKDTNMNEFRIRLALRNYAAALEGEHEH